LIYYPITADAGGYKNPYPDSVIGYDIVTSATIRKLYRYDFIIKNHRATPMIMAP